MRRTFHLSPRFIPILAFAVASGVVAFTGVVKSPVTVFLFVMSGWLISLCLHEFGHAIAAYHGGDRSVAGKGYLTLDPTAYTDPVLSILLPLVFLLLGGIGLPGGSVYIDHNQLRGKHWQSFVAAAGPLMTLACLVVLAVPLLLGWPALFGAREFWAAWSMLAMLQVTALLFNLLPIPGLDGFGMIQPYLPREVQARANQFAQFGVLLLFLALSFVPAISSAFWTMTYAVAQTAGIDTRLYGLGYSLFKFWNFR